MREQIKGVRKLIEVSEDLEGGVRAAREGTGLPFKGLCHNKQHLCTTLVCQLSLATRPDILYVLFLGVT
jgi:hypothetical protein